MKSWLRAYEIIKVIKSYDLHRRFLNAYPNARLSWIFRLCPAAIKPEYESNPELRGQALKNALQDLGPVFIKFGQALSTRPDLLPPDISSALTSLQDNVPPFSQVEVERILEQAYQGEADNIFSEIDLTPKASASVAQVHFAVLKKEQKDVVIKILRPGIEHIIDRDVSLLYYLANKLEKLWSEGKRLKPTEVVYEYDKTIHNELDLVREAANASQLRANFEKSEICYVPEVYFDYTHVNVMVMERIKGINIRDINAIKETGMDIKKLAHDGVEIFFTQVFRDGFFHADMHPGNIFISDDADSLGQYRAIDFGIMGTLSDEDKHYLAVNFLAFFNRDYRTVAEAHIASGWVPSTTRVDEFESAVRTVCEPIFAKPMSEISFAKVVMRLFQVARQFEMPVQPQLVLLQKTMMNIEGLGRQLYPDLDLWDSAKPILEKWMRTQVGHKALLNTLKKEAPQWAKTLPKIPNLLHENLSKQQMIHAHNMALAAKVDKIAVQQKRSTMTIITLVIIITVVIFSGWIV